MSIHYNAQKVFEEVKSAHSGTEINRNIDAEILKEMDNQIADLALVKGKDLSATELALIFPDEFRQMRKLAAMQIECRARVLMLDEMRHPAS